MKKILICSVVVLTTAISCKNKQAGGDNYSNNSSSAANEIITYTNALVDLSNSHNGYLEDIIENTDKYERGLGKMDDKFAFTGIIRPMLMPSLKAQQVTATPPDALSDDDQKYFSENVSSYMKVFDRIKATNELMHTYISAEDYKDDKGSKGKLLIDSLRNDVKRAFTTKDALMIKATAIADASEVVILKDNPLKDYILAMKVDAKAAEDLLTLLTDNAGDYKGIATKAQQQYDAIEVAIAKHSKIDLANAKKESRDGYYQAFYERMTAFLGDTRKAMRTAAETGVVTDGNISSIESDYESMISRYNSFNN
jgi:hypothetical protein